MDISTMTPTISSGNVDATISNAGPVRVLIVRLSALGDTALTLPLAYLLKQRIPNLHLGWVVGEQAYPLLQGLECIDKLHILPQSGVGVATLRQLVREIRGQRYQFALDPQGISRSALLPWLAGIPHRVGMAPGKMESRELAPLFLNHFIQVPPNIKHITERTLYLSSSLGIDNFSRPPSPLFLEPGAVYRMRHWWGQAGLNSNTLIMSIGAGWPTKVWPAERVQYLVEAAAETEIRAVLLWGPAERHRIKAWHKLFRGTALLAPLTNIQEMIALLNMARGYAGPDTAALHLAWLLGKPTFSWFGASDPVRCAPQGPNQVHVACGPHNWRRTSLLGNPLRKLTVERVLASFKCWLSRLHGTQDAN